MKSFNIILVSLGFFQRLFPSVLKSLTIKINTMKRACKIFTPKSTIKTGELHTISLKTYNFNSVKTTALFTFLFLVTTLAFGQKYNIDDISVKAPKFQNEFYDSENEYFSQNAELPSEAKTDGIQGVSVISFTVCETGELEDVKIVNSLSREIDEEVLRLLEATNGQWTPGKVNGEAVSMPSEVSVAFVTNSTEDMIRTAKNHMQRGNKLMYEKNKPHRALHSYNQAATMLPNEEIILVARILCNYELNEMENAEQDFERLKTLAERNGSDTDKELYADLDTFVKNKKAETI